MNTELKDLIKEGRNNLGLSQDKLAGQLGVDVKTVGNWEAGRCTPNPSLISSLISTLKLDRDKFDALYLKAIHQEDTDTQAALDPEPEEFPDFLFPDEESAEKARNMSLTAEEQRLLGMELLYNTAPVTESGCRNGDYTCINWSSTPTAMLPYAYVSEFGPNGALHVLNIHDSLSNKLDLSQDGSHNRRSRWCSRITDFVIERVKANPDRLFDFKSLSWDEMMNAASFINVPIVIDEGTSIHAKETLNNLLHCAADELRDLALSPSGNKKVGILDKNGKEMWDKVNIVEGVIEDRDKVFSDHFSPNGYHDDDDDKDVTTGYNKAYSLAYDRYGSALVMGYATYSLRDQDDAEAKILWDKYMADLAFYNEHRSMLDKEPEKPEVAREVWIKMTEKGRRFLGWYNEHHHLT